MALEIIVVRANACGLVRSFGCVFAAAVALLSHVFYAITAERSVAVFAARIGFGIAVPIAVVAHLARGRARGDKLAVDAAISTLRNRAVAVADCRVRAHAHHAGVAVLEMIRAIVRDLEQVVGMAIAALRERAVIVA